MTDTLDNIDIDLSGIELGAPQIDNQHTNVLTSFIDPASGRVSLGVRPSYITARIAEAQMIGDRLLDDLAKSWQYDDFLKLVTYVTSTIPLELTLAELTGLVTVIDEVRMQLHPATRDLPEPDHQL